MADVNKCIIYDILLTNKWYTECPVWLNYIVWFVIEVVVEEKVVKQIKDYYSMNLEMLCNSLEDVFGNIKFCYEKELKLQYSFRED